VATRGNPDYRVVAGRLASMTMGQTSQLHPEVSVAASTDFAILLVRRSSAAARSSLLRRCMSWCRRSRASLNSAYMFEPFPFRIDDRAVDANANGFHNER